MAKEPHTPTLLCPTCDYDVSQTIRDRRDVCPECGTTVSEASCRAIPRRIERRLNAAMFTPLLAVLVGLPVGLLLTHLPGFRAGWPIVATPLVLASIALWFIHANALRAGLRSNPSEARDRAAAMVFTAIIANFLLACVGASLLFLAVAVIWLVLGP